MADLTYNFTKSGNIGITIFNDDDEKVKKAYKVTRRMNGLHSFTLYLGVTPKSILFKFDQNLSKNDQDQIWLQLETHLEQIYKGERK